MSAEAREAVARKLFDCYAEELGHADAEWDNESSMSQDDWRRDADAVLAALQPFIAAEIRAWANGEFEAYDRADMDRFDVIASRICGADE